MKTACIYHSIDLDGWMSAAIVKYWYEKNHSNYFIQDGIDGQKLYNGVSTNNPGNKKINHVDSITFIGFNNGDKLPDLSEYDKIIMCDISFSGNVMREISHSAKLIWIDHHISSMNDVNKSYEEWNLIPPIKSILGIRDIHYAACELTWKYFFPNEEMPEIVRLLGRYDCFGHMGTDEEKKILEFQYGARNVLVNYEQCYNLLKSWSNPNHREMHDSQINHMWLNGQPIYSYLCTEARQVYKNGFEIWLKEPTFYENGNHTGVTNLRKFICINKERFNPINFGIKYHEPITKYYWCLETTPYSLLCEDGKTTVNSDDSSILKFSTKEEAESFNTSSLYKVVEHGWTTNGYDGAACFHYADGQWYFSLYNENKEVDCSAIAKQFGGGGHKGAAGFRVNDIEFLKIINS